MIRIEPTTVIVHLGRIEQHHREDESMTTPRFEALPTDIVDAFRSGALDANDMPPERFISDGSGIPCRHCLSDVAAGEPVLVLAYRPFPERQPYAEIGPIFLHAEDCDRYDPAAGVPPMILARKELVMRGYDGDHRIVEGTGRLVRTNDVAATATALLDRPDVVYLHTRCAWNTCYQCRIERGSRGT